MRRFYIIPYLSIIILFYSCKHDPYPGPTNWNVNLMDTSTTVNCDPDTVYFNKDVLPLINSSCAYSSCHDASSAQDGVILNNYQNIINTGDVRAGDLNGSDLYEVITENDLDKVMPPPPNSPLSQSQIAIIGKWILQGAKNINCTSCDSSNLRYVGDIQAIVNQNCVNCHGGNSPSAGLSLINYQNVKSAIQNNNLKEKINEELNFSVMPPGGKMNDCDLSRMNKWINSGAPE